MLRHLAKTVIVLAVSALPAVAQGHPGSHMRPVELTADEKAALAKSAEAVREPMRAVKL